jgi:hypothetical protein
MGAGMTANVEVTGKAGTPGLSGSPPGSATTQLHISANVTADFGIVTGLRVDAGLRGFDCRDGVGFVG